ncbi:MAG: hypothetical protein CMF96_02095 [Candidatus Marinimicrobia bacterium]|nr:hypothetical protein [Candidatus Neomarinimicrobiota bacterium]|tara:strand:+ start:2552 stop:4288 length:1737 start_codon:yes stop_codon:yes gene_type:complete
MKFIKYLLVFFFLSKTLFSENKIVYFNGGKEFLGLSFQSRLFSDSDVGNLNFGNTNSSSFLTANQFRANPAVLGYYSNFSISLDMSPGFDFNGVSTADMILGEGEFDKLLNDGLVSGLQDSEMAGDIFDPEDNTKFNENNYGIDFNPFVSQKRSINGFSVVLAPPIGYKGEYGQIGISHRSIMDVDLELLTGGVALTIEDADTTSLIPTAVKLPLTIDMGLNLGINFSETDFAYGIDLGQLLFDSEDKFTLGFGLNYLKGGIYNNTVLTINGMIRQIGEQDITAFFNDPTSSYRNTLNDSVLIDFSGTSFQPIFGMSYNRNSFFIDLSYSGNMEMIMDGSLNITTHTMGALNLSPNDEDLFDDLNSNGIYDEGDNLTQDYNGNGEWDKKEELFDMFLLKPSALTFTNRTQYKSSALMFKYPGKVALSFAYKGKFLKSVLGFEKPLGEFSMLYECDIYEDGQRKEGNNFLTYCPEEGECDIQSEIKSKSYEIIAAQNLIGKFGLGLGRFYLGGSFILGDIKFNGLLDSEGNPMEDKLGIPLGGTFGMGLNIPFTSKLNMDISLLSYPGLAGSTTFTYSF